MNGAVPLSPGERLERAVSLLRDGDPQSAFVELTALQPVAPASIRDAIQLNAGLALNQLRRYDESNKVLEPLASGKYEIAVPAIYTASKNYLALSASINPIVTRTIIRKQKITAKVTVGKGKAKRTVTRTRFANVRKTIQRIDLAKKAKKDEADRLATERLKDLLQIKAVAPPVRLEVLNTLIGFADAKKQDAYVLELVSEVVKLDPYADPALQHFWDKAWAAYVGGDLTGAKPLFRFIADTYGNPNVKRQSEYWYARTIERLGEREESQAIYRGLASAPYEDIYAINSVARGAPRAVPTTNPLRTNRPDWRDIAEQTMPADLRLAYELTALDDMRDAQLEIRKNAKFSNQRFADALMADLYHSSGNTDLLYRTLRRAFPQLATVQQDEVPPYFVKMYYPVGYVDAIQKNGKRFGVDPYLAMALILQESYYNPKARSRVGATGLMQLMPGTGKELARKLHGRFSVTHLEDPETNIELGMYHLQHMIQLFAGQVPLAVASYNAGQGNVLKWRRAARSKPMDEFLESIPFPETRNYVKRVTLLRSSYARITQ
jgi:soluble lytic murein transglycosylase